QFHIGWARLRSLIAVGKIAAGYKSRRASTRFPQILVSERDCELAAQSSPHGNADLQGQPPADGEPPNKLASYFGIDETTIRAWCRWKSPPGLGRKMRSGIGPYVLETSRLGKAWRRHYCGLLVSRADVKLCAEALKNPMHRRFPENPGVWIAAGIFQCDD